MEEYTDSEAEYQLTGNEECFTMQTPPGTQTPAGELINKILLISSIAGIIVFGSLFLNRWINREKYDSEIKEQLEKEYQESEQRCQQQRKSEHAEVPPAETGESEK